MCSWIAASVLPPLRRGSLICSQIWRQRALLPGHDVRRDMPERVTWNARRLVVRGLVAGGATHPDGALVVGAAHHEGEMRMNVGALRRPLADRMAIQATRMLEDLAGLDEQGARALGSIGRGREAVGAAQVGAERHRGHRCAERERRHAKARKSIHGLLSSGAAPFARPPNGQTFFRIGAPAFRGRADADQDIVGSGFRIANIAPCGSTNIARRPTSGMSLGGTTALAPSDLACSVVLSQSATQT